MPRLGKALALLVAAAAIIVATQWNVLVRLYHVTTLFKEHTIVHNFRSMDTLGFPTKPILRKGKPASPLKQLPTNAALPETFEYKAGKTRFNLQAWLEEHNTTGLIVMKGQTVLYENYWLGNTRKDKTISWSVGKSFVSALAGIAVQEGKLDIEKPVTFYAPELASSGYNGVRFKDVLQMSSGVGFDEDYFSFMSDINRMGRAIALGQSINKFAGSLQRFSGTPAVQGEPGKYLHYNSMDTQVLGLVIRNAVNMSLSDYLTEKLWSKVGFEDEAYWVLDNEVEKMELAFGGLNMVLRDYLRFAALYRDGGRSLTGERVLSEAWVKASVTPDAPHLMPGLRPELSNVPFGYGYQWWIPCDPCERNEAVKGDFLGIGVYNQFIYVDPATDIAIARSSAFVGYNKKKLPSEQQTAAAFRAISAHFAGTTLA